MDLTLVTYSPRNHTKSRPCPNQTKHRKAKKSIEKRQKPAPGQTASGVFVSLSVVRGAHEEESPPSAWLWMPRARHKR